MGQDQFDRRIVFVGHPPAGFGIENFEPHDDAQYRV